MNLEDTTQSIATKGRLHSTLLSAVEPNSRVSKHLPAGRTWVRAPAHLLLWRHVAQDTDMHKLTGSEWLSELLRGLGENQKTGDRGLWRRDTKSHIHANQGALTAQGALSDHVDRVT